MLLSILNGNLIFSQINDEKKTKNNKSIYGAIFFKIIISLIMLINIYNILFKTSINELFIPLHCF